MTDDGQNDAQDDDTDADSEDERSRSERLFHGALNVLEFVLELF